MEIKKREVIFSVIIIAVMLAIGFSISGRIRQKMLEDYQVYDTAVQIESEELFRHGMRTNIGNAFMYGKLETLDPVTFPAIEGQYSYIKKCEEEYRRHTRTVTKTYTDSKGKTHTKTEIEEYWTWDTMRTEEKKATKISFLDVEFEYEKISFPSTHMIDIVSTGYHTRDVYYGTDTDFQGTLFAILKDNTIDETSFYRDKSISETIDHLESGMGIVVFWIFWILLIAVVVVGFCYLENKWLD